MRRFEREHEHAAGSPPRGGPGQRGAAATVAVLFLPVLVAGIAALSSLGQVIWLRNLAYQAADMGALAGVQALDLEQLADGRVYLLADEAGARAIEYARANIAAALGVSALADLEVQVRVINPGGPAASDPVTGRAIIYPTVCVVLRFPRLFRVGPVRWVQHISAHADASVVPR